MALVTGILNDLLKYIFHVDGVVQLSASSSGSQVHEQQVQQQLVKAQKDGMSVHPEGPVLGKSTTKLD